MTEEKIQMFLMSNQKKFSQAQIATVTERLRQLDDDKWLMITSVDYKDPTLLLVLSILAGGLGIDRFLLGDTGIGVLKLLTAGCLGVLTVILYLIRRGKRILKLLWPLQICRRIRIPN